MRYLILIAVLGVWLVGWLPSSWAVALLFTLALLARTPGQTRRRGGSAPQLSGVSNGASPGTVERVATYTSSPVNRGDWPEARAIPTQLADLSRITAHGSSTAPTDATNLGARMTVAADRPVRMDVYGLDGKHEQSVVLEEDKPWLFRTAPGDCGCNDAA